MIMSMNTAAARPQDFAGSIGAGKTTSFFKRMGQAFVDAQTRAAHATVARQMQTLSTDHLHALGLSDAEIKELRASGMLKR